MKTKNSDSIKRVMEYISRTTHTDHTGRKKIYLNLNHVSKSQWTRSISVYLGLDTDLVKIDWDVADVVGSKLDERNGGVKVSGVGMDMGFKLIDDMFYALGIGSGWQSNYKVEWM